MKLPILIFLTIGVLCSATESAAVVNYRDVKPMQVIDSYRKFSGKLVVVSADVRSSKQHVSVSFEAKTKKEACDLLEHALLAQAGVELIPQTDGTLLAQNVQQKKEPNQPPEPTR